MGTAAITHKKIGSRYEFHYWSKELWVINITPITHQKNNR